ncbi:MAG: hypothetical protein A3F42_02405 [Gammaproteobacteria bacterium RIFCSPHIGHO2_12_FULL_37_34]|nr:MAG: hypothetical protein A3F42_02405 [Gammaproteobacteria bacterium RIFCSPHIGHO2_12_FULL_37_34]
MIKKAIFIIAGVATLTSCASITTGTKQSVSVHTEPTRGAICTLENNKGKWFVNGTPGTVTVNRSFNDLQINCEKPGYQPSLKTIGSKTKAIVFGNAIIGGVIGAGIDMADGAAYEYPNDIYIPMKKGVA